MTESLNDKPRLTVKGVEAIRSALLESAEGGDEKGMALFRNTVNEVCDLAAESAARLSHSEPLGAERVTFDDWWNKQEYGLPFFYACREAWQTALAEGKRRERTGDDPLGKHLAAQSSTVAQGDVQRQNIFKQIADQFPAQVPPDDYQFEFIFGVKLDYRDWRTVLTALSAIGETK